MVEREKATRDEAFMEYCDVITALQRKGMPYDDVQALNRAVVAYGAAAAREARERSLAGVRPGVRPGARVVRTVDGVAWLE
jgi:hypothetical protein